MPKAEQWNNPQPTRYTKTKVQQQKQIDFIPDTLFVKQLSNGKYLYSENHFIQWLGNSQRGEFAFDDKTINHLIESYFIANSNKYKGWVLFPYIDINGKIRDIKAMDYNPTTGKRIATKNGDSQNRCFFIGKEIINNPEANTDRSFYGEHLLRGNNKMVRIFESEATATHSAPYFPDSVCIATGGNNGCKWTEKGKCSVLQGRVVILYPDIDAHDNWEQKAEILRGYGITVQVSTLININALKFAEQNGIEYSELVKLKFDLRDILQHKKLSDLLERKATEEERKQGLDIADYLIRFSLADFKTKIRVNPINENQNNELLVSSNIKKANSINNKSVSENTWIEVLEELEKYFSGVIINYPVKINQCQVIVESNKFIDSHISVLRTYCGKQNFSPFLDRLISLKNILELNT